MTSPKYFLRDGSTDVCQFSVVIDRFLSSLQRPLVIVMDYYVTVRFAIVEQNRKQCGLCWLFVVKRLHKDTFAVYLLMRSHFDVC